MRRVVIESPYAGDVAENVAYAARCVRDCLQRYESGIASHLLYTQHGILDDNRPADRERGIKAGLAWHVVADAVVFYTDRGWSRGMIAAHKAALAARCPVEIRSLADKPIPPPPEAQP